MKNKVMIAIDSFFDGGSEMFAIRLANALSTKHSVYFLEYHGSASKKKTQKRHLSSSVILFSPDETLTVRLAVIFDRLLKRLFSTSKIDLTSWVRQWMIEKFIATNQIRCVSTHAYHVNTYMALLKNKLPNLHLVLKNCGHYELFRQGLAPEIFDLNIRLHIQRFDGFIFLTNDQLSTFLEYGFEQEKAQFIYNGLDLNRLFGSSCTNFLSSPVKIILISRAIPEKGWLEAIETVNILNSKGHQVELTLVGDGELYESLLLKALPKYIKLVGEVENVFPLIHDSDIGLLPSFYHAESLPNSIIEYLSMGKPVVATTLGAIPEMLSINGEIAGELILATRGQPVHPSLIVNALTKLISDSSYYQYKAYLASLAAKKFDMKYCLEQYERVLKLSH